MSGTMSEFMAKVANAFPGAEIGEDNDGQLVIYTGLTESDGEVVEMSAPLTGESGECVHCERTVYLDTDGRWVDPEATGDDSIWREVCDQHDAFYAPHEVGSE